MNFKELRCGINPIEEFLIKKGKYICIYKLRELCSSYLPCILK